MFRDRSCNDCHSADVTSREDAGSPGPDHSGTNATASASSMVAAMWNHAPQMHEVMAEQGVSWPKFEEGDLEDIVAFLRRLRSTPASAR